MPAAPLPLDEPERLRSLKRLDILDSAPEQVFDALVAAAALVCGVPISLVSLVDSDRQWFLAQVGLPEVSETPRDQAFCGHTIHGDDIFEVPDAQADPRFADNPLVTASPDIRFYAGATLRLSDGAKVGTLCVIDHVPRQLTVQQREVLRLLAVAAVQALESRRLARGFLASEARFRTFSDCAPLGVFATDAQGHCTYTNARWQSIFGVSAAQAMGMGWVRTLHPDDADGVLSLWQQATDERRGAEFSFRVLRPDGTLRHARCVAQPVLDAQGLVTAHVGSVEDTTERQAQERSLRQSEALLNSTGALAQVGGWALEVASGQLTWSAQTCRIHGLPPGHQPQLAEAIQFYAPQARPVIEAAVAKALADGSGWDLELLLIPRGGQPIWVRAVGHAEFEAGQPVRLLGAFQDINLQVQQRQSLEAAQQRVALATESGGIGIWENVLQTDALYWDARMYGLFGLPADTPDNPRLLWQRHVHPADLVVYAHAVHAAMASGEQYAGNFRVVWPDGSVHHLQTAARLVRDSQGQAQRLVGVNWDVTALRALHDQLAEQHALLRVTLQSIRDAVITTDAHRRVTWLNPTAERLTGWLSAEAMGRPLPQIFHTVHEDSRQPMDDPVAASQGRADAVGLPTARLLISRSGHEVGIEDSVGLIHSPQGQVLGAVLVFRDVTEQRRLSGEMAHRAKHDPLTGLVNRAEFEARLGRTLDKSQADQSEHALLFIDLDQFKLVNDACGHAVGDQLLQQVARLLGDTVRHRDTLARLGGDEFGVLLAHCTVDQAQRVAQQICDRVESFRFTHGERSFRIGASIGLVPVDARWASTAAVVQAADTACYAAKEAGRNRVHAWFDTDATLRARQSDLQWASRLTQALDENRFVLYAQRVQPVVANPRGLQAEVLLRLQDSDGRLLLPEAFLPAAERFHMATRIDAWVLQQVLQALQRLPTLAVLDTLCINLSGQSVGDRAFHQHALHALAAAGPAVCQRLCLEISEAAATTRLADAAIFATQVRALGVRIALDDVGAGAFAFGYLKHLTVDQLKIDGSVIRDLVDHPLSEAAVRCIVDVARVVGAETVAEGVDRPQMLQCLQALGVHHAQGFLLHRPEPIENLLQLSADRLAA